MQATIDTLGLWYFDQTLYDSVMNNNFLLNNEDPYVASPAVTGAFSTFTRFNYFLNKNELIYGLNLANGVSYEADVYTYTGGDFTLGFWAKTTSALGFVRHYITREKTPKTSALIGKGDRVVLTTEEDMADATFVVTEEGVTETTNRAVLMLSSNGTTVANWIYSDAYSPGLHHFLVTYDGSGSQARIDIDGHFGTWQTAPAALNSSSETIKLNCLNPNYLSHQTTERSIILRDLYLKNSSADDENEAIRNYTYGMDYVTDITLSNTMFDKFAVSYTQPNTIKTKAIVVNGSSIYLGMSNGDILKGTQPIWDNEFTFDSTLKNELVNATAPVTYSEDGIILSGSFVKI